MACIMAFFKVFPPFTTSSVHHDEDIFNLWLLCITQACVRAVINWYEICTVCSRKATDCHSMNQCCQIEWESMMPGTQALIDDPSAHHGEAFHLRSASPFRSTPPRHLCKSPSCLPSPGQADQPEFPEALQGGPPHQAAPAGLHHPHPALDLCAVL